MRTWRDKETEMEMTRTTDGRTKVIGLPEHTDVITWNNSAWPAWSKDGAVIVDLRLFDPHTDATPDNLIFRPEKLAECGVPDEIILAAAESEPQGFVLLQQ